MSNEERNSTAGRDPEATVVKPFFNEAAEETARPVVPLAAPAVEQERRGVVVPVPDYAGARRGGSVWPAALIVISLLTGLVVGVAGLRLYQRSRTSAAQPTTPAAEQTSDATQATGQETTLPAPVEQPSEPVAAAPEASTPAVEDESADVASEEENERTDSPSETRRADDEPSRRERENTDAQSPPRAEREDERDARDERRARRERDDDDDESAREIEPRPGVVYDTQGPSPEGSAAARRAEREEQRLRRAERQRRREDRRQRRAARREEQAVDSVRGIFEGQPPE
ncbi:MAG TPA: hypothetical protein VFX96_00025 [Pyrinomonadaceae bacterium]|nr:hypothetical protein [Pyrinomonadaceae bacterium]